MYLFRTYAGEEEVRAVEKVIQSGLYWLNGPEVTRFERQVANVADRDYAVSFNSGTSALFTSLLSNGIVGEVILPAFTYPATANAVYAAGAQPVFADIEHETMGLDVNDVKEKVGPRTAAIVPVHFAGGICRDITDISELASDHGAIVIEDSAHSLGAEWDGSPAGSFGKGAMFSFSFNKVVSTGAGGMFVTDDEDIAKLARQYSKQGKDESGIFYRYGYNFVMPSINAAIGTAQMEKLDDMINMRREMAKEYDSILDDIDGVNPMPRIEEQYHVFQTYNVFCDTNEIRNSLIEYLEENDIPNRISYTPVTDEPFFGGRDLGEDIPATRDASRRILTIPFHLCLKDHQKDYIFNTLKRFNRFNPP